MKKRMHALTLTAALTVVALAGCTPATPEPSSSGDGARTGSAAPSAIPTIPTGTGVIKATKMTSCETTGADVTAKGTVNLPKGTKGDVVVSVSWVNSDNSSVYARGTTTLKDLTPGDSTDWTTSATLPPGAKSVACVLGSVIPK